MTEVIPQDIYTCAKNNCDLRGAEIPEKYRQYHGDATHYSELISLYSLELDRTTSYKCPKCGATWART